MDLKTDSIITLRNVRDLNQNDRPDEMSEGRERECKLREQCKNFEAIFITQIVKAMEKTIPKSSLYGSNNNLASMMFSSVMGDAIAKQKGLGLGDIIYRSLKERDILNESDKLTEDEYLNSMEVLRSLTITGIEDNGE